jgi:hypothetical protein
MNWQVQFMPRTATRVRRSPVGVGLPGPCQLHQPFGGKGMGAHHHRGEPWSELEPAQTALIVMRGPPRLGGAPLLIATVSV